MRTASAAALTAKAAKWPCTFFPKTRAAPANLSTKLWKGSRRSERREFCLTSTVPATILSLLRFLYRGGFHENSGGGISCAFRLECGGGGVSGEGRSGGAAPPARATGGEVHVPVPAAVSHRGENGACGGRRVYCRSAGKGAGSCISRDSRPASGVKGARLSTDARRASAGFRKAAPGT